MTAARRTSGLIPLLLSACLIRGSNCVERIKADNNSDAELNERLTRMQGVLRKNLDAIKTVKNNSSAITTACSHMVADIETELGLIKETF